MKGRAKALLIIVGEVVTLLTIFGMAYLLFIVGYALQG